MDLVLTRKKEDAECLSEGDPMVTSDGGLLCSSRPPSPVPTHVHVQSDGIRGDGMSTLSRAQQQLIQ